MNMRDEDIDWELYHMVVAKEKYPVRELIDTCALDKETVLKSLTRLEKNCLIDIIEEKDEEGKPLICAQILSLQEVMMRNQIKCSIGLDSNSPVILENGIIKENPNYKPK